MTCNLHPNSDIDYLYVSRCNCGRGIKQIRILYESNYCSTTTSTSQRRPKQSNMRYIVISEEADTIKVGKELLYLQHIAKYKSKNVKY